MLRPGAAGPTRSSGWMSATIANDHRYERASPTIVATAPMASIRMPATPGPAK